MSKPRITYNDKCEWVQRWAKACGELNECKTCPHAERCQQVADSIYDDSTSTLKKERINDASHN